MGAKKMENTEVKNDAIVPSTERLRDPESGKFLARPSKSYIESRQAHKEKITLQMQDVLQGTEADLEPTESDTAYVALLKAQIKNGINASGKDAGPAVKLIDSLNKAVGIYELPPAEQNHGVKVIIVNMPEAMMNREVVNGDIPKPPLKPAFIDAEWSPSEPQSSMGKPQTTPAEPKINPRTGNGVQQDVTTERLWELNPDVAAAAKGMTIASVQTCASNELPLRISPAGRVLQGGWHLAAAYSRNAEVVSAFVEVGA
jgi:hypothetical protein